MFKKLLLSSCAAVAISGSAIAADLPARMAPPPPPPVPVFTWTGAYVGINGGGLFRSNNQNNGLFATPGFCTAGVPGCTAVVPNYSALIATGVNGLPGNNNGRGGFLGGGQIGINYQVNPSFVFGGEIDGQGVWTDRNNNNNFGTAIVPGPAPFAAFPVTVVGGINHRLEYLVTARLRAGFLATPALLIYGTGGAAFGGARTNGFVSAGIAPPDPSVPGFAALNNTQTKVGWTAGGGLEWMFAPNWSLKGEALYYDLGRFNSSFAPVSVTAIGAPAAVTGSALVTASTRERGIIARGGLNYHFGWTESAPVVARY